MAIDDNHARLVCKFGNGSRMCRYLAGTPEGFSCLKHTDKREFIDERVSNNEYINVGDNCEGILFNDSEYSSGGGNTCKN